MYEGFGQGRCNCEFTKTYPYAFGPRLGATYKLDDKTVVRGRLGHHLQRAVELVVRHGWLVDARRRVSTRVNWTNPAFGEAALRLRDGLQYNHGRSVPRVVRSGHPAVTGPAGRAARVGGADQRSERRPARARQPVERQHSARAPQERDRRGVVRRQSRRWLEANNLVSYNATPLTRFQELGLDLNNAGRPDAADVADRFCRSRRRAGSGRRTPATRAARPSRRRFGRSRSSTTASRCAGRRSATPGTTRCTSISRSASGTGSTSPPRSRGRRRWRWAAAAIRAPAAGRPTTSSIARHRSRSPRTRSRSSS